MIERMALVQRARDARMARSLVEADRGDGAVLIAGAGHVRTDRGVPLQLRTLRPGLPVASVAFQEVADDSTEPGAYADTSARARLPFDYVWFTARVDAVDPCERFKNRPTPGREAR
jgi:heme-binding uptake protein ChaN (Tiki superfamily)